MDIEEYLSYKIYCEQLNKDSLILDFPARNDNIPNPRKPFYPTQKVAPSYWTVPRITEHYVVEDRTNTFFHTQPYQDWLDVKNKKIFINHSYEPIDYANDKWYWDPDYIRPRRVFCNIDKDTNDKVFLLHSEKNSKDVELVVNSVWPSVQITPVHWFANGYVCAEYWYKNFGIEMFADWRRPIKHKYVCMARQFNAAKKYRLEFLNLIDTNKGCYSLLDRCPETNMTPNDVLPSNTVSPYSFDDHGNDSAYIELRYQTPVNTSFLHVVMESVFDCTKQYFTEKIFKPIVLQQPFVLVGPAHNLKYLRSYGFKTFDQWWDESYDDIEDSQERLHACAKIVNTIAAMDTADLYYMREQMSSVLEHNRNHFYSKFSDIVWKDLQTNLSAVL